MGLRRKVTLVLIVLQLIQMNAQCLSLPQTFSNNPRTCSNRFLQIQQYPKQISLQTPRNFETRRSRSEKYNEWFRKPLKVPENEYCVGSKVYPNYHFQSYKDKARHSKKVLDTQNMPLHSFHDSSTKNNKNNDIVKTKNVRSMSTYLPEFSSAPNYRDIGNFPDVEYPLCASELWKPNYWDTVFNDQTLNQFSNNFISVDAQSLVEENPVRNVCINNKAGVIFPSKTKPYNDITKSGLQLRNPGISKNTRHNNINLSKLSNNITSTNKFEDCYTNKFTDNKNKKPQYVYNGPVKYTNFTNTTPYTVTLYNNPSAPNTCNFNVNSKEIQMFSIIDKNLNATLKSHESPLNEIKNVEATMAPIVEKVKLMSEDKGDKILLRSQDVINKLPCENEKEIEYKILNDEDYTTDDPEEVCLLSNVQSTPAPQTLTTRDFTWRDSKVIEKTNPVIDELNDYFLTV